MDFCVFFKIFKKCLLALKNYIWFYFIEFSCKFRLKATHYMGLITSILHFWPKWVS